MKKRLFALALTAALLLGCLVLPVGAAFPDITDPALSQAVGVLQQLQVVNGKPGGVFDPQGALTRAEFCKMTLTILGRQDEAALQSERVVFSDVTAAHWALGYVNAAAASGEDKTPLVQGMGDGRFCPNDPVTGGSAVAILMRALGYSDKDVAAGGAWYAGYMVRAKTLGLLDGVEDTVKGGENLNRAAAAQLFYNLLFVKPKGGAGSFLTAVLGGSVTEPQLVLELGKRLSSGKYAVTTEKKDYCSLRSDLPASFRGRRAELILDRDENVLALREDPKSTVRTVRILAAEARYILVDGQERVLIPGDTPVWRSSKDTSTYSEVYAKGIPYGATALLCYNDADTLTSVYLTGQSGSANVTVLKNGSKDVQDLVAAQGASVYKSGVPTTVSALKPYDVAVYDGHSGTLNVYDNKLTGVYEDAAPSLASPAAITVMGCELEVLDSALEDLSHFKLGDGVTVLLDGSNRVAGVVSPAEHSAQAVGVAKITSTLHEAVNVYDPATDTWTEKKAAYYSYTAKVALANGLEVSGEVSSSVPGAQSAPGKLVAVSSSEAGALKLSQPASVAVPGSWNVEGGKVGSLSVSPAVVLYDQTEGGPLVRRTLQDVSASTVAASGISLLHTDSSGSVDVMVLRDLTGDAYVYGVASFQSGGANPVLTVSNKAGGTDFVGGQQFSAMKDAYIGIAPSLSAVDGTPRIDASLTLRRLDNVRRTAFEDGSVTVNGIRYPLSENIDDCCYNEKAKTWFGSLDDALAFTTRLTLYYDKLPTQGGKIRMVVAD